MIGLLNILFVYIWTILAGIALFIILALILWYYKSIIHSVLLPRLKIEFKTAKFLSRFVPNENLDVLIKFRTVLDDRFGKFTQVPLILVIGSKKPKWNLNSSLELLETNDLMACVNSQMGILWIHPDELTTAIGLLNDIMEGRAYTGVLFPIELNNDELVWAAKINHLYNYISSVTGTICQVIVTILVPDFHAEGAIKSIYDSVGIVLEQKNETYYNHKFDEFIEELDDIYISDPTVDSKLILDIDHINSSKDSLIQLLNKLSMDIYGIFFTSYREGKEIFINDVFYIHANNMSNDYEIAYNNKKNTISYYFTIALFIVMTIITGLKINSYYQNISRIEKSIHNCLYYLEDFKNQNIWEDIGNLNMDPTRVNREIFKKPLEELHEISQFMINKQLEQTSVENSFISEVFLFSPVETKNFYYLDRSVTELNLRLRPLADFDPIIQKRLGDYDNSIGNNIIKCFDLFFKTFTDSLLYARVEILLHLMDQMASNDVSLQTLIEIRNTAHEIQQLFGVSSNSWWINKDLGQLFNSLIDKIPDKHIQQQVKNNLELELNKFADYILSAESILAGKIFTIESQINGKKLGFTNNMQSFLNTLNYIIQEPLVNIGAKPEDFIGLNNSNITMWNLSKLDDIIRKIDDRSKVDVTINNIRNNGSNGPLLANVTGLLIDKNLHNYFINSIKKAHEVKSIDISLEDKVNNFVQANAKLENIEKFIQSTFGINAYFLEEIRQDTLNKIMKEVRTFMDNSIFTSYLNLNKWNNEEPIIRTLFQCSNDELGILFSKSIVNLRQLKTRILLPIITYLHFNMEQYEYAKYIIDQVDKYEINTHNHIKLFEDFILSLRDWEIKWRPPINILTSNKEFFFFHTINFKALLIEKTNKIAYENTCNSYNKLASFFNERLAGNFPFGGKSNTALSKDIILFVNNYNSIRENLYNNDQFMKLSGIKQTLKQLDLISDLFIVEGSNLFVNIKMECLSKDMPGAKNTNLILKFHNKFGDIILHTDSVNIKYNIQDSYSLQIEFINSSILKLTQMNGAKVFDNNVRLEFFENYGFLNFVENLRVENKDEDAILKIIIPVVYSNSQKKSNVILFMKVRNWPIFPIYLKSI